MSAPVVDALGQPLRVGDTVACLAYRATKIEFGTVTKLTSEHRITIRRLDGRTATIGWAQRLLKLTPSQARRAKAGGTREE